MRYTVIKNRMDVTRVDNYLYRCPVCGFVYQVPEYWASYSPDEEMEFAHIRFDNGEACVCEKLVLVKEEG